MNMVPLAFPDAINWAILFTGLFCDCKFYPSPPKSLKLPTYANNFANQLAGGSYQTFITKYHPGRELEYLDIEAFESDGQASDADLSDSRMSSSSGDHSDLDLTQ